MSLNQYAGGIQKLRFENEFPHFFFGRLDHVKWDFFFFCNIINKQTVFLIPNFRIWYQLGLSTNLKCFSFYSEKT